MQLNKTLLNENCVMREVKKEILKLPTEWK